MRVAALQGSLKYLTTKSETWSSRISKFKYKDISGIGSGEASFSFPITVITGPNSAGKTTLLRSIWFALDPQSAIADPLTRRKIRAGEVEISFLFNGNEFSNKTVIDQSADYAELEQEYDVIHIDSAEAISDLQKKMFVLGEAVDIINGAPDRIIEQSELDEVAYLARRQFDLVRVYEVEIEAGVTAPFFVVDYKGSTYDSTQMGSGEYASLFLWWTLWSVKKGSFLLIEEPETFLSPSSQESILNYLVSVIERKRLCVVTTSHSGHLLHFLPPNAVRFLKRNGIHSQFDTVPHPRALESVGIYLRPDIFVYVEDFVAKIIANLILERYEPTLARRCKIAQVGGEAVITKSLRDGMDNPFGLQFVGWYDGDQAGKIPNDVVSIAAALPGVIAMEKIFRSLASDKPGEIEQALGVTGVSDVLISLEGDDAHDWLPNLAKALGRDKITLLTILFQIWHSDETVAKKVKESFQAFQAAVNV